MTRDFRKGAPPPRRRTARRGTCAFWFLTGGLLGAIGVGFAWMKQDPPAPLSAWLQPPSGTVATTASAERPAPPTPPQFSFYSRLPEEKVVVPPDAPPPAPVELPPPGARLPSSAATQALASAPEPVLAPTGRGDFLLQVGSFKRTADAEKRKAELALLGVQTSIQTVTAQNGQTYYRVRTGAYDKPNANTVQARLRQSGHDSMMIRAR